MPKNYRLVIFSPDTGLGCMDGSIRRGDFMRALREHAKKNPNPNFRRVAIDEVLQSPRIVKGAPFILGWAGNASAVGFIFPSEAEAHDAAPTLFDETEPFSSWVAVALYWTDEGQIHQAVPGWRDHVIASACMRPTNRSTSLAVNQ